MDKYQQTREGPDLSQPKQFNKHPLSDPGAMLYGGGQNNWILYLTPKAVGKESHAEEMVLKNRIHPEASRKLESNPQVRRNSDVFKRRRKEMEHGQTEHGQSICHEVRASTIVT